MRPLLESFAGLYELLRLGAITRFRFRSPYWRWRLHTAFGGPAPGRPISLAKRVRAVLAYGRWIHRMRRSMR
jgi:hypothetical protein